MTNISNVLCGTCNTPLIEVDGGVSCPECNRQLVAEQTEHYKCPADGILMSNEIQGDIVVAHCPQCKSFFMSNEKLDTLLKAWYDRGLADGKLYRRAVNKPGI